jgi:transcriptional regulator with XRE-family HTH domain
MNYTRLGQRIREERQKLKLTQSQLAEAIDISDTYVGQIERGERSLTLDTLVRLVNRLGVSIDYLLKDSVTATDDSIINQFRQIIDTRSDSRKQMALDVVKTMFAHLDGE